MPQHILLSCPSRANGVPRPLRQQMTMPLLKQSYSQKDLQRAPGEPATPSLGRKVCKSQKGYKEDWNAPGKTEVTQGSGPRLGKSRGTLCELSSGGLEGPTRRATKGKKGHSGVTSAPEGNLCPPKTPTGGTPLPSGKQGKSNQDFYHTPKPGKELQVSPLRKRRGE